MNDFVILTSLFVIVCAIIATFFLHNIYRGVHANLASATCGDVYNFRYMQPVTGDYDRYLAKVLNVRKLSEKEIARLNFTSEYRAYDKDFYRSPTLVTCEMPNGDIRNFYAERSDMCKRTAVGNLLFKMGIAHVF